MITMTRPIGGWGIHQHPNVGVTPGFPGRPVDIRGAAVRQSVANMSGPLYQGMDPSNPATFVRPWNPAPGMIAYLNFDGAAMQAHTPTQIQRGPQSRRPRKLRVGA
jgi:hypothetical protein